MKTRDDGWQFLRVSLREHTAHVDLNRPPVNALNRDLIAELTSVARSFAKRTEVWAVALSSSNRSFCAGADLKERATIPGSRVASIVRSIQRMIAAWLEIKQPVIAGIRGAALGGGLELALAADIIVASDDAILGLPEVNLGIIPAGGGTQRLAQRASLGVAAKWVLSGARFGAGEAFLDGVVDYVVPAPSFDRDFQGVVSDIASCAPLALRQAKKALTGRYRAALLKGFKDESECYAPLVPTEDRSEALRAFAQKRKPVWQGK